MPHKTIKTQQDLDDLGRLLHQVKMPMTVQWTKGLGRSLDQNAIQWAWAGEAATQLGDRTADEIQRDWKLRHGVPILRSENEQFRAFYDSKLKHYSYEEKLDAMRYISVSSVLSVKQMAAYLDAIQRECLQNGIHLTQ